MIRYEIDSMILYFNNEDDIADMLAVDHNMKLYLLIHADNQYDKDHRHCLWTKDMFK